MTAILFALVVWFDAHAFYLYPDPPMTALQCNTVAWALVQSGALQAQCTEIEGT